MMGMSRILGVAVVQSSFSDTLEENLARMSEFVAEAAKQGAQIVLLPELFAGHYFCKTQDEPNFARAAPWRDHPCVRVMGQLAALHRIVIPVSIFEKAGPCYFNSLVMIDADGACLGIYRKSHIPDGPGYQEKYYFRPGDTGFRVFRTRYGAVGAGICWDQWFPEAARIMALGGADILLYPTAIGSEPQAPQMDTAARWRRAMLGHAVSNVIPVAAANRTGIENGQAFYGSSFIADETGELICDMDRVSEGVGIAQLDLARIEQARAAWGFFRDRRTDLYARLSAAASDAVDP
jgi:N-carbamoylputrescine amidase